MSILEVDQTDPSSAVERKGHSINLITHDNKPSNIHFSIGNGPGAGLIDSQKLSVDSRNPTTLKVH